MTKQKWDNPPMHDKFKVARESLYDVFQNTTMQQTSELGEGRMLALHAGIPHSVLALEKSVFLLTLAISKP